MHLQATASRAATLLAKNPALFCRVMIGKIKTARPMPPMPISRQIGGVKFEYDMAHYRGTAPMYFGSYAPLVIDAMKRFLRPGSVFIDAGANIGYLSAIAAGLVGEHGQVHAFEPVPAYYERLCRLCDMNPRYKLFANAQALGDFPGVRNVYVTREPGQNTLLREYRRSTDIVSTIERPVIRLDDYVDARRIREISLIKIDAEGFELPILKGLERYFSSTAHRPPVICEIAPRAYPLQGKQVADLAQYMSEFGYSARDLIDTNSRVNLGAMKHVDDVVFLEDGKSQ